MLRYLAFTWDESSAGAASTATTLAQRLSGVSTRWRTILATDGLRLLICNNSFVHYAFHLLGDSQGAVLGLLFDRANPLRNSAKPGAPFLGESEQHRILATEGRDLVKSYWGRYVAFMRCPGTKRVRVLRDPVGDLLCYRANVRGVDVYFSDLEDFLQLKSLRLTVDWRHLAARVITGNAWAEESALNEIETVHPGECFEHSGNGISRTYYWNPLAIATSQPIEEVDRAAAEIYSSVSQCAHAWACLHQDAVHVLSGGLDSSIVLASLTNAPNKSRIRCLNFRTRDPDSDERVYARMMAQLSGCDLVEQERAASLPLNRILECRPTVGPASVVMRGLEVQPLIARFAQDQGATAVFSGDGGDMVFFRGWPQLAVIDCAHQNGMGVDLLKLACDSALPAQLSVWQLLYQALLHGTLQRPWDIRRVIFDHYRLVTDAVAHSALDDIDLLNPWGESVDRIPPGKRLHAFSATRPCLFRDPLSSHSNLDMVNPLVSQPVLESCLRIPTYIHAAGGRDRSVARDAFAHHLPREIILRTWKGAADRHLQAMLTDGIHFVRELLLDGGLVKEGILDREKLEQCLSGRLTRGGSHPSEVFGYLSAEAWLRSWLPAPQVELN